MSDPALRFEPQSQYLNSLEIRRRTPPRKRPADRQKKPPHGQLLCPQKMPPFTLFLDFDGTLTLQDTMHALASIPYTVRANPGSARSLPAIPPWPYFTSAYLSDVGAHNGNSAEADRALRTNVPAELRYLDGLRPVEKASLQRVEAAGVFRGVCEHDVREGAKRMLDRREVELRKGWEECVQRAERSGGEIVIVTANWSEEWVRACLEEGWRRRKDSQDGNFQVGKVFFCTNKVQGLDRDESDCHACAGRRLAKDGGIWTAGDKQAIVREWVASRPGQGWMSMYVGDSVTDLGAFCEVDVAICIRSEEMSSAQRDLAECLERTGCECRWVGEFDADEVQSRRPGEPLSMWWARDFDEITRSSLFGLISDVPG